MNGVVAIDKPAGVTSHDVVAYVRRLLGIRKIGHAGTLDPLATGVLPLCINEGTKLIPFFERHCKEYRVSMRLGVRTDTLDREGQVIEERTPSVTPDQVAGALQSFVGKIRQFPPRYSAVKFQGRPLYAWARKGIEVAPRPRTVEIFGIAVESIVLPEATFRVCCGKGTYMRTLCADAGEKLGCGACLSALRRTASGPFREASALRLGGYPPERQRQMIETGLIGLSDSLPELPSIEADAILQAGLKAGIQPAAGMLAGHVIPFFAQGDMVKFTTARRDLVAVARALHASDHIPAVAEKRQIFQILRVFNEI